MARTPPCAPTISASPPAATTSSRSSSRSAVAAPSSVSTADRSNARWAAGGRARRRTPCHEAKHCRKRSCPPKRSSARPSRRSTRSTRNPGSWVSVTCGEYRRGAGSGSTDALSPCLELLLEGSDIELLSPGARILMRHVPEALCDRSRTEHVLWLQIRTKLVNERHIDCAVHVDVRDVNAPRPQVARHHLRQAAERELGRPESRKAWEWTRSGGGTREDDGAVPFGEHRRHHFLRAQERAGRVHSPGGFEGARLRLHETPEGAHRRVVKQHVDVTYLRSGALECRANLFGLAHVDRNGDCPSPGSG